MRDPYEVLGVAKTASEKEMKSAYRKLAKEFHPDLNPGKPGLEERFKEISAAYGLLSDAEKRAKFDRGEIDASGMETPQREYYRSYADGGDGAKYYRQEGFADQADLDDFLSGIFGGGGPVGAGRRAARTRRRPKLQGARRRCVIHHAGRLHGGGQGRDAQTDPA